MTAHTGWTPDPDAAAAKLQAVHDRLTAAIADLTQGPAWQQMLQTAAHFHHYSPHNVLLITSQRPDASAVAGFGTWQQLGRQVRKGETGIAILAPVLRRPASDRGDTGRPDTDRSAPRDRASTGGPGTATDTARGQTADRPGAPSSESSLTGSSFTDSQQGRRINGFRVVHVFDLSQTDGPDLPTGPVPQLLEGAAPPGLYDGLAQQVRAEGFQLIRQELDLPHLGDRGAEAGLRRANGVTDYVTLAVTVRPDLTDAQASKTLAHELGHVLLHRPETRPEGLDRPRAKIEAESVAYLVTAAHGLAADDYTVPYVTGWSAGDLALVQRTAERVLTTAQHILQRTPPPPAFNRPELAGTDRHLQRTPRREASRGASRAASRGASRAASRGVKGDIEADAGRSSVMSRDLDLPSPVSTGPHGRPRGGPAADQAGLW